MKKPNQSTILIAPFCFACLLAFAPTLVHAQNKSDTGLIDPKTNAITDGLPHSTEGGKALMNPNDVAILLLDHQSGLFQVVKDIGITELRANVTALAKLATLLKIPIITTASEPGGPERSASCRRFRNSHRRLPMCRAKER